jgi:hypothetical protein
MAMPVPTPHTMMPKRRIDEEVIVTAFSYSVMDPDPHWFWSTGSGSRRANMILKNRKKGILFEVLEVPFKGWKLLKAWTSFIKA